MTEIEFDAIYRETWIAFKKAQALEWEQAAEIDRVTFQAVLRRARELEREACALIAAEEVASSEEAVRETAMRIATAIRRREQES